MSNETPASSVVVLGFAFHLQNPQMQVDLFGSPHEVRSQLAQRGLGFSEIFDDLGSTVDVADVTQGQPLLRIHGGPHAEKLVALLEALDADDADGLEMNADVLQSGADGVYVPLLAAAARGHRDRVERLVKVGAIPDLPGDLGMSPLHWAAARGHGEVASVLVGAGASQTLQNWFLVTAAELAALNGHDEVARQLGLTQCPPRDLWVGLTLERMRAE